MLLIDIFFSLLLLFSRKTCWVPTQLEISNMQSNIKQCSFLQKHAKQNKNHTTQKALYSLSLK
jgi:hypothetical protein